MDRTLTLETPRGRLSNRKGDRYSEWSIDICHWCRRGRVCCVSRGWYAAIRGTSVCDPLGDLCMSALSGTTGVDDSRSG